MTPVNFQHNDLEEPLSALRKNGFCVIDGYMPSSEMPEISAAYDRAAASASAENTHVGRSSTRVGGMLEAEPIFVSLYKGEALHAAARQVIGGPFKLSCFHARTLHRVCDMGEFHIDFRPDEQPFPLLSFIVMIEEFSERNGATRFVPGSQHHKDRPSPSDQERCIRQSVPACGPAGSVIIFDGRVWHAHGANSSSQKRRSLQGSFIPASETSAMEFDVSLFDPNPFETVNPLSRLSQQKAGKMSSVQDVG